MSTHSSRARAIPFIKILWPTKSLQEIVVPAGISAGDHFNNDEP
jgi:hypothetical protein